MLAEVVVVGQGTQKKVSVTGLPLLTVKGATSKGTFLFADQLTLAGKLSRWYVHGEAVENLDLLPNFISAVSTRSEVRATPSILLDGSRNFILPT